MSESQAKFRYDATPDDLQIVRRIIESTGFFYPPEVDVAVELVDERLAKGPASGYHFVFAEVGGQTVGYACYGPIACTVGSYDLFWMGVEQSQQGRGLGRSLVAETERLIRAEGGRRIYIETSNRPQYASTRGFHERSGYQQEAVLKEFYGVGDDKVIFTKIL
jgi:D-alanine-D-alanine ligase